MTMQTEKKAEIPPTMKFVLGGASGMCASVCVQPLDLLKNRMQMSGIGNATSSQRNSLQVFLSVIRNEGFFAIYSGLSAGLLRQATYSTARLGIYTNLFEQYTKRKQQSPNFLTKISIAVTAGICAKLEAAADPTPLSDPRPRIRRICKLLKTTPVELDL
uniref:Mitochondrial 2-oxoglutarate/malate carrier protein n=1 Tax=Schistosoma japonicum TaxID=6182 RepID=C7TXU4_SCHJA|nr:Mitochondrial 2-oxoglutarate/malate carrier protein [Schistosoma japonicum]